MSKKKRFHRDCEPHDAAHCDINDHDNLVPGRDDCGHYVPSGPGYQMDQDAAMPGPGNPGTEPPHSADQDPGDGPGVK